MVDKLEEAWQLHEAVTGMGIDSDPLSCGMVLNLHLKRKITEADKNALLAAINGAALGTVAHNEAGDGQDRKFGFRNGQFVNRVSGEPIPHDEPIIIFRARDHHSIHVLREYLTMATDEHHRQAIRDRMAEFSAYATAHPELMKEPGITHHIELNDSATPTEDARERVKALGEALRELVSENAIYLTGAESDDDEAAIFTTVAVIKRARTALGNKETDRHG